MQGVTKSRCQKSLEGEGDDVCAKCRMDNRQHTLRRRRRRQRRQDLQSAHHNDDTAPRKQSRPSYCPVFFRKSSRLSARSDPDWNLSRLLKSALDPGDAPMARIALAIHAKWPQREHFRMTRGQMKTGTWGFKRREAYSSWRIQPVTKNTISS